MKSTRSLLPPRCCVPRLFQPCRQLTADRRTADTVLVHRPHSEVRRGTSLTEVLAAILVMSVGVLSVMTLFPIAIIRSLQATQLTNATILAKRAEALVEMYDLTSDRYIPQPQEGRVTHAIIDPLGWNDFVTLPSIGSVPWLYGHMGEATPVPRGYLPPGLADDNTLTPQNLRAKWPVFKRPYRDAGGRRQFSDVRVLNDPSGSLPGIPLRRLSFGPVGPGSAWGDNNGGQGQGPPGPYPDAAGAFTAGGLNSQPLRDQILAAVGLPDHFDEAFVGIPDGQSANGVTFDNTTTDLSFIETHDGSVGVNPNPTFKLVPGSRAVLIDQTGSASQVREVLPTGVGVGLRVYDDGNDWVVEWLDPLPFAFISEVRIEIPQSRYTWTLTVRKRGISGGSVSEIDCVTFINRPLGDPEQELLHRAFAPVEDQRTVDPPYQVPRQITKTGPSDLLTIWFSAAKTQDPPIKKGGWLFDPQNALWYRMVDIAHESSATNGGSGSATVQLDRKAEAPINWVTVPQGVVNVFPLRSRVDQKRLDSARR